MNVLYAKAVILVCTIAMVVIRAPHGQRSRAIKIVKERRTAVERFVLKCALVGFFIPLVWIFTPAFGFAEFALLPVPFATGVACLLAGLWLFHRSHADLGTNWSITLQMREGHALVTRGIYRHVRHPMYSALILYSVGQALVIPNWFVAPTYLVPICALIAVRLKHEEAMMIEEFGDDYRQYALRTRRLIPGVW